jgi:hypothetical protein
MKIFGIGLAKSGTTSLSQALTMLGYLTVHDSNICESIATKLLARMPCEELDKYDAFTDWPHPLRTFSQLAEIKDSLFILTVRDREQWLQSCLIHVLHSRVFDSSRWKDIDTKSLSNEWDVLYGLIVAWGITNPGRVLIFDCSQGWNGLCEFLNKPVPSVAFPHENKSNVRINDLCLRLRASE